MKKRYAVKTTPKIMDADEKKFGVGYDNSIESQEKTNNLLRLLNHPWRLIKEGGKLGVKGIQRFFTVLFLFAVSNAILIFYAINRLVSSEFAFSKVLFIFLILIMGLTITIYVAYRTYQYIIIDSIRVIYENLSSLFIHISELIIDKVVAQYDGKVDLSDNQFTKALNFGKMVNSGYQKAPRFLRKGIILILNKIPFVGMLVDLKADIYKGDKHEASIKLYNKMNRFITESIFGKSKTRWIMWLLPLYILLAVLLIEYKIG